MDDENVRELCRMVRVAEVCPGGGLVEDSRAVFSGTAEHITLLIDGWVPVAYDGAVLTGANGALVVRQVVHLSRKVGPLTLAKAHLLKLGIDLDAERAALKEE
jgi:hypothetical protein